MPAVNRGHPCAIGAFPPRFPGLFRQVDHRGDHRGERSGRGHHAHHVLQAPAVALHLLRHDDLAARLHLRITPGEETRAGRSHLAVHVDHERTAARALLVPTGLRDIAFHVLFVVSHRIGIIHRPRNLHGSGVFRNREPGGMVERRRIF